MCVWGGCGRGDTVTFQRVQKLWNGEQARRTGLSVPPIPLAVSGQKPDTEKENFLLNLLLGCIIHRSHLMEMPSSGAAAASGVTECRSASWAVARVSLTLQVLIYAAKSVSERRTAGGSSFSVVLATVATTSTSDWSSPGGGAHCIKDQL